MTSFERRQRVLDVMQKQPGIRVPEVAKLLGVSEGTVRNDLRALAADGQLKRVRGGAVIENTTQGSSPAFSARARVQADAKERMARWAADLVEDGDSILFDASTTVYYLARFLHDRRNLTVITNGVEIARSLAQNPSNTVILLGGVLGPDGMSVTGPISERVLEDLHIKTAFLSATGIALDTGLYEVDIHEAQLKRKMIDAARSVVALIDASKFGKVDLLPFARLDQVSHIFVDDALGTDWIDQLRLTAVPFTICAEDSVSAYTPSDRSNGHYRIGFANLTEQSPMCVDVRRGLERAAHAAGNIDLVMADNQLSGEVALQVADRFVAQNLDLVIEYQIDEQVGSRLIDRFRQANIPVIAVDIPMVGATYFGVDNYRAGHLAGVALGEWIEQHWACQFDRLIILDEPRAGALPAARIHGQLDGLQSIVGEVPSEKRLVLNSGNTDKIAEEQMLAALKSLPAAQRLAVISFNDDTASGALSAARKLHREGDVVIVGQGADRRVREELHNSQSRIIGSTTFSPELYGEKLIPLALKILRGEPVPPAVYMEHTFVRAGSIGA